MPPPQTPAPSRRASGPGLARAAALALTTAALILGACDDSPSRPSGSGNPDPPRDTLPDFTLMDVNPNSPSYQDSVSPRDYLERVSAWYFGQAT